MISEILIVFIAFVASFTMALAIGAESNSPPFAPAVGAGALPVMRAAFLVGVLAFFGAILQGARISETVGSGLVHGVAISPLASAIALLTAATFIAVGVVREYPIPAAFTITGAVIGVGLALGGVPAVDTYRRILFFWLAIPVVGGTIAFLTVYLLRRDDVPETLSIPILGGLIGATIAHMPLAVLATPEGSLVSIATYASYALPTKWPPLVGHNGVPIGVSLLFAGVFAGLVHRAIRNSVEIGTRNFLIWVGAIVAFSSGGSQVGLATGPLEATIETTGFPMIVILVFGGIGLLFGSWTSAPRVIHAVSYQYSVLGIRRSIAALVPAFVIAQLAIITGLPVSFNQIIISTVIGSGLIEGGAGVSSRKIGYTVGIWVCSTVGTAIVGYTLYTVLNEMVS